MFPLLPELVQLESDEHLDLINNFPIATSASEALVSGTNGFAVCISV
jgi:hypothetical protein